MISFYFTALFPRYELMKTVLLERDRILTQFRAEEFNLVSEMNNLRKTLKDLEESRNANKDSSEELQQKLDDLKVKLQDTAKRNQDLQVRCNELSKQCQRERKQRYEIIQMVLTFEFHLFLSSFLEWTSSGKIKRLV